MLGAVVSAVFNRDCVAGPLFASFQGSEFIQAGVSSSSTGMEQCVTVTWLCHRFSSVLILDARCSCLPRPDLSSYRLSALACTHNTSLMSMPALS